MILKIETLAELFDAGILDFNIEKRDSEGSVDAIRRKVERKRNAPKNFCEYPIVEKRGNAIIRIELCAPYMKKPIAKCSRQWWFVVCQ